VLTICAAIKLRDRIIVKNIIVIHPNTQSNEGQKNIQHLNKLKNMLKSSSGTNYTTHKNIDDVINPYQIE